MRSKRISTRPARRPHGGFALRLMAAALPLLLVLACEGERGTSPLEPTEPTGPGENPAAALLCTADVRAGTLACATPEVELAEGVRGALTVGGQHIYVTLAGTNVSYDGGTEIFQADVTVQNLIEQALGTTDGVTGDTSGVRVFFTAEPAVTAGSGTVTVANPDDTRTFTQADQPFFQYGGETGGTPAGGLGDDGLLSTNETSDAKLWQWNVPATVIEFEFSVFVHAEVQYPNGWLDITPAADTLDPSGTVTLTAAALDVVGDPASAGTIVWSSSVDAIATVTKLDASTAQVTAVAPGTVTITADDGTLSGTATITVGAALADDNYLETVIGNVSINSANAAVPFSVTDNDAFEGGASIAFAGWGGEADSTEHGGTVQMTTASGTGMGQFTYEPPTGFEGTDRFHYVIGEDTATVALTIADMVWFIDNSAPSCTSVAAGCGRLSSPLTSLAAFNGANNGTGNNPGDGDVIFLYESATPYTGPLTLLANQILVGQDATADLATIAGLAPPDGSTPLPAMNTGGDATTIGGASDGIVLGTDNTLRGLTVATTGGTGIAKDGFGALNLASGVAADVIVDVSGGPALDLSNGTFAGAFLSVSANGGANGMVLSNTTGTFVVGGNGSADTGGIIQNMTGDGISLDGTAAVVLNWMTIQNNLGSGIRGNAVVSLALRNATVDSNGDAAGEHGLHFTGLTGTSEISTSIVSGSRDDGVSIANTGGTLDLEITDSDFSDVQDIESFRHGVTITASGTAIVNLTATGNEFTGHETDNLSYAATGTAGGNVVISQNTFSGGGDDGISIIGGDAAWGGTITYDVDDNVLSGSHSNAIRVEMKSSATAAATMSGTIRNNTIGTSTEPCGDNGGIFIAGDGDGEHSAAVTGNVIDRCDFVGIAVSAAQGAGRFDLRVQGNEVTNLGASALDSFEVVMGNSGDTNTLCLVLGGTTIAEKNTFDLGFEYMFFQQLVSSTPLLIPGFSPGGGDLSTELNDFLKVHNLAQGGGNAAAPSAWPLANVLGAPNCNTP